MARRVPRCPDCPETPYGVEVLFGLPDSTAFEAAERGEVVLGGCLMPDGSIPRWACPQCERPLDWGEPHPDEPTAPQLPVTPGHLRVATWNVEKCPQPEHAKGWEVARWQGHLGAHIWLLTEVHRDWESASGRVLVSPARRDSSSGAKRWAAIQTPYPMDQLDDDPWEQPAAEESLCLARVYLPTGFASTSLLVACSVLPWGGAGKSWPGLPEKDLNRQQAFVLGHHSDRIAEAWDGQEPIVWGGDFNQELVGVTRTRKDAGYRLAGTTRGIDRLRAAFERFGLRVMTERAAHLDPQAATIDHLAISAPFAAGNARVHRPHYADGRLLSDHAAYVAEMKLQPAALAVH